MDYIDNSIYAESLFISSYQQQTQLETLSNQALSRGIDLYSQKNYEGAATEFKRAISLSPNSTYSVDSTKYLAQSYLKLEKTDKAIEAYQNTLKRHRNEESLYTELGNLFFSEDRYDEAVQAYQRAVDINPDSTNQYSLGQGQLKAGNYGAAMSAFQSVIRLEPESPYGYGGLGNVYAEQGDYKRAIQEYEIAVKKDFEYYDGYLDMGYAYADMGEMDEARELVEYLEDKDENLSKILDAYIEQVDKPKMLFAWGSSTFRYSRTFQTPVSSLNSYLETANSSVSMNVKIQFSKDMDRSSIENTANWEISRAAGPTPYETYNYGEAIPDTEISIESIPNYVLYDADNGVATVSFSINQNSTADGTIDPSHIVFKFKGEDSEGIKMDADYDEFSGFSGVA